MHTRDRVRAGLRRCRGRKLSPGVADLAVGAAILHHILDPAKVLASCHRALKPGGWAIFFEPFEAGNTIVG